MKYITHFLLSLTLATTAIAQDDPNAANSEQATVHTEEPGYIQLEYKGKTLYQKEDDRMVIMNADMDRFNGSVKIVNDSTLQINNAQILIKNIAYVETIRAQRKAHGRIIAKDSPILMKRKYGDYDQDVQRKHRKTGVNVKRISGLYTSLNRRSKKVPYTTYIHADDSVYFISDIQFIRSLSDGSKILGEIAAIDTQNFRVYQHMVNYPTYKLKKNMNKANIRQIHIFADQISVDNGIIEIEDDDIKIVHYFTPNRVKRHVTLGVTLGVTGLVAIILAFRYDYGI